ncbi:MAG: hypothetical protein V2I24_07860, partial [Halieaceae bacterium]|nr:hypothetical protein [Halieaceae bacterium]
PLDPVVIPAVTSDATAAATLRLIADREQGIILIRYLSSGNETLNATVFLDCVLFLRWSCGAQQLE